MTPYIGKVHRCRTPDEDVEHDTVWRCDHCESTWQANRITNSDGNLVGIWWNKYRGPVEKAEPIQDINNTEL